jgi:hypothetical protein
VTARWEYLSLVWTSHFSYSPTAGGSTESRFKVSRPGSDDPEERPGSDRVIDILNELGAEGWELTTMEVQANIVGKSQGWSEAGRPVRRVWMFKRPVPEA